MRLFRDERLEKLTVISPQGFAAVWFLVLGLVLYASWGTASVAASIGFILLGMVLWTLVEYVMHRFLFHLKLSSKVGQRLVFLTHGNHHVEPEDGYRNIMPPIVSLWVMGSFWGIFVLLLGSVGSVLFLGFAIGYVVYDSVHYACHQYPMRRPVLRQLRRHHIRHHYAKREGNYAITAIFWDRMFGTNIPDKAH